MGFRIVEIEELSGPECKIYSIAYDGDGEYTLFDEFLDRMEKDFPDDVAEIWSKLEFMGREGGARIQFFRENEGVPGDGVVALLKEQDFPIRLYAIRYGSILLVLGSGGYKNVAAWQEDDILSLHATEMMRISALIMERIKEKDITICPDGSMKGDLYFED
jgi:hypothetical protein